MAEGISMQNKIRAHPLDRLIKDNSIFMLEAMIPFVDIRMKKLLVFFIKLREISEIISMLDNPRRLAECGFNLKADNFDEMLEKMCDFLPDDISQNIHQTIKMINMMKMMDGMDMSDFSGFNFGEEDFFKQPQNNEKTDSDKNSRKESDFHKENSAHDSGESLFDSVMSILDEYDRNNS